LKKEIPHYVQNEGEADEILRLRLRMTKKVWLRMTNKRGSEWLKKED
jgi:hypothetical protein